MIEQLKRAEDALLDFLSKKPSGATMIEIMEALGGAFAEPELRAAVWTLKASGAVDFEHGRLRQHPLAA